MKLVRGFFLVDKVAGIPTKPSDTSYLSYDTVLVDLHAYIPYMPMFYLCFYKTICVCVQVHYFHRHENTDIFVNPKNTGTQCPQCGKKLQVARHGHHETLKNGKTKKKLTKKQTIQQIVEQRRIEEQVEILIESLVESQS